MEAVTSRLSKYSLFAGSKKPAQDSEDVGETTDATTMAGGGRAGRQTHITRHLRVSPALRAFLVREKILAQSQVGSDDTEEMTPEIRAMLDKPHVQVPKELMDRSHPLPDYFISSSHNTYLLANQLYGGASAEAYKTALKTGSRCVEIDAWDSELKDEPKVTHGYTLTSSISFRSVCEMIRDVLDGEIAESTHEYGNRPAPILISLENHCDAYGQRRLVEIMRTVFGDRLLSKAVREKGTREQEGKTGENVRLEELGSKIAVIVEYHFPNEPQAKDTSSEDEQEPNDPNDEKAKAYRQYQERKRQAPATDIIPELAELGVYAQSVKPPNNLWYEVGQLNDSPHHPMINVSETSLLSHMPTHNQNIARHNSNHLMRVYPKGTRISSQNLNPVPFWGIGAHICALNWQTFGASMQLNEALFTGTEGYVLKPASLRLNSTHTNLNDTKNPQNATPKKKKLRLHIAGASSIPLPEGRTDPSEIKPYLTCTLVHPSDQLNQPPKRKTQPYKQHKLGLIHKDADSPNTDPIWNEVLEWEYQNDNDEHEMTFLRLLVKSDDAFARNPIVAVTAVRLTYVLPGWSFIRMLDLKGRETRCCLLVRFEILDL